MNRRIAVLCALAVVAAAAWPVSALQKRQQAPMVEIRCTPPPAMKAGDEATTTATIRALIDVDRLRIDVVAIAGLEVVAAPERQEHGPLKAGQSIEASFKVRLTAQTGRVAVESTTWVGAKKGYTYVEVKYGDDGI